MTEGTIAQRGRLLDALESGSLRLATHALAAVLIAALFAINYRFILVHFSNGGYLLDSGWFAYLFGSANLALPNPRGVLPYSYYNIHISPYLALFGMPLKALGLDGYTIFALHEGLMFALFAAGLYAIVATARPAAAPLSLLGAALAVGVLGKMVWQITGYPHFEIATIALCAAGAALQQAERPWVSAAPFAVALLVREDGGLFVALFLIGSAMLRADKAWDWGRWVRAPEFRFAAGAVALSAVLFWVKAHFFFRYPTFELTYSGKGWDHLGWAWLSHRLAEAFADPKLAITAGLALALGAASWRYLIYPALVLPLIVAQLLAVSDSIGRFQAYYAMPWLVVWTGLLIVAAMRAGQGQMKRGEGAALLVCALLCSVLVPNYSNGWRDMWPISWAMSYPVMDLASLARELDAAIGSHRAEACLSVGAIALLPDAVMPDQLVTGRRGVDHCGRVFLFDGDMEATTTRQRILDSGMKRTGLLGGKIEVYERADPARATSPAAAASAPAP